MVEPAEPLVGNTGSEAAPPDASNGSANKPANDEEIPPIFDDPKLNEGLSKHGCSHYRRRCRIKAPCCGEVFSCRHCHNEQKAEKVDDEHHELPRHEVKQVVCSLCDTEQEVQQFCSSCGVCMGQYFCGSCRFFDDDIRKKQFHCKDCGICRVGGAEKFFHCRQCGCCYSRALQDNHRCVEKAMNHNCPVCFEYLFDSLQPTAVLEKCGHTLHHSCLNMLAKHTQGIATCPMCSKSIYDYSDLWASLDDSIAAQPMPQEYRDKEVRVVCNDCDGTSQSPFHFLGLKCVLCGSYNTRQ